MLPALKKIDDLKAFDCQLCLKWVCLTCSGSSEELFDFLQDNDKTISVICKDCKHRMPYLREMKAIKQKQAELEEQVKTIKTSTAKMKTSVEAIQETQTLQGTEINRHETELKEVFR